jgi:restriction system protein
MKSFNYKYDDLFNPVLKALKNLGGSGSNPEIEEEVIKILELTDEEINDIHRGSTTKLSYRLAWAKNYLKRFGLLENSQRSVWALTEKGKKVPKVEQKEVVDKVKLQDKEKEESLSDIDEEPVQKEIKETWQEKVITILLKFSPKQFEQLSQRMLRELGFLNVEVTGRSGDGGVDGRGIIKIGGVLSFHIIFQCKRFKNSVSPDIVRDFRDAMDGRAEKGLIITTGSFTREAKKEAQREGATQIDLIDGNDLAEKLKELKLGIKTEMIEKIIIDDDWFKKF